MVGADGTLPEAVLIALREAGYTGIEPNCYQPHHLKSIVEGCRSAGLAIHALPTGRWLDVAEALEDYDRYTERAFEVLSEGAAIAASLDVPLIFGLVRGPGAIPRARAEAFLTSVIFRLIQATPHVSMLVEPIAADEAAWPHTLDDGARLLERLKLPQVKLLADSYHIVRSGQDPRIERYRSAIGHLHIRDHAKQIPTRSTPEYAAVYASILRLWREEGLILSFEPHIDLSHTGAHAIAGAQWIEQAIAQA
ncbi:MAG TPA: TIM barrel protein [Herpetosiphonaceae bacterium]